MANEYRTTDADKLLSKKSLNQFKSVLESLWETSSVSPHQCLKIDDFILVKSELCKESHLISLKSSARSKNDILGIFPKETQPLVKEVKDELKMTHKELKTLKTTLRTKTNQLNNEKDIKEIAIRVKRESNQEKFMRKFRKNYSEFNEKISDNLLELKEENKQEVKTTFSHLSNTINDYKKKL